MAIGSGLGAYVGLKAETVFGTYVAPDRFHEPSGEVSWGKVKNVYQGGGVASGRMVQPGTRRVVGVIEGFRCALLGHSAPDPMVMAGSYVALFVVLIASVVYFRQMERQFADVI